MKLHWNWQFGRQHAATLWVHFVTCIPWLGVVRSPAMQSSSCCALSKWTADWHDVSQTNGSCSFHFGCFDETLMFTNVRHMIVVCYLSFNFSSKTATLCPPPPPLFFETLDVVTTNGTQWQVHMRKLCSNDFLTFFFLCSWMAFSLDVWGSRCSHL